MNRLLAAAAVLALSACGTTTTPINGPNGLAYEIDCSRGRSTMGDCYNAAAKKCANGYRVLGVDNAQRGGGMIYGGYLMPPPQNQVIIVECK